MATSAWLSLSDFDFNVELINKPRLDGFLLDIRISMNICTFVMQPFLNTFQKIEMCGGALKVHGNDEATVWSNLPPWPYRDDWLLSIIVMLFFNTKKDNRAKKQLTKMFSLVSLNWYFGRWCSPFLSSNNPI